MNKFNKTIDEIIAVHKKHKKHFPGENYLIVCLDEDDWDTNISYSTTKKKIIAKRHRSMFYTLLGYECFVKKKDQYIGTNDPELELEKFVRDEGIDSNYFKKYLKKIKKEVKK